jgi:hypothetical protein
MISRIDGDMLNAVWARTRECAREITADGWRLPEDLFRHPEIGVSVLMACIAAEEYNKRSQAERAEGDDAKATHP